MKIPKTFQIFGQTIKVIFKKNLIDKEESFGIWDYNKNIIYLQPSTRKHRLTKEQIESTFVHEYLHTSLDLLGYEELSKDEKFVNQLSLCIHQIVKNIKL